jgi:hypothetical protein
VTGWFARDVVALLVEWFGLGVTVRNPRTAKNDPKNPKGIPFVLEFQTRNSKMNFSIWKFTETRCSQKFKKKILPLAPLPQEKSQHKLATVFELCSWD